MPNPVLGGARLRRATVLMLAAPLTVPTAVAAAAPSTEAPGGGVARDGVVLPEDPAEAGLLDQLDLHIAPVLVGDGMRLFEPADLGLAGHEAIELTPTRVIDTPEVTHVRYQVDGRSLLGGDRPD